MNKRSVTKERRLIVWEWKPEQAEWTKTNKGVLIYREQIR